MSRYPRFRVPGFPLHIVQRGNDRQRTFFADRDYRMYLKCLGDLIRRYDIQVHAYALMTNHVHLLATPGRAESMSRLMQALGSRYVAYVNATQARTGTLWEGRYKACLVDDDNHVLCACRYIDLNPVRAGIVSRPADYRWSSHAGLVGLVQDPLLTPHPSLSLLGSDIPHHYARWCQEQASEGELTRLREATAKELVFGRESFMTQIEAIALRPAHAGTRGRPRRTL